MVETTKERIDLIMTNTPMCIEGRSTIWSRVVSALSRFGPESFRSWVVSALSRFDPGSFRLGSFRPNLVGRFGLIFFLSLPG